jgi:TRAP-type C4-dicarboxylate transport system substrate-binding protein
MTPVQTQTVEALGGSAVSMPFFDVIPSLEKGVIDGGVNLNAYVISMFNWYDAFKYATVANMFGGYLCLDINLDAFNAMPEAVQDILLEEGEWLVETMTANILAKNSESETLCTENGIEVYYLPDAERALWAEATSSIVDDFFATLDAATVTLIQNAIAEANE